MRSREDQIGVLFVCMGNICRSPVAEGLFLHLARERQVDDMFDVDSAGTGGWHAGERADRRALAVARKHGVELPSRARQVDPVRDWARFHHIIAMDRQNVQDLLNVGAPSDRLRLLRSFDPALAEAKGRALDVPDPYYGDDEGFDAVFAMATHACKGLLEQLLQARGAL
ncbi:MAG: low molecular weight phosphotyrosine protein phosphatase [Phycisphaerales bacterium]|nr:low molecular weight phosphotyrosine protein phosphatase [Phycisphaerales bacterium]